jgi:hypothetical protein
MSQHKYIQTLVLILFLIIKEHHVAYIILEMEFWVLHDRRGMWNPTTLWIPIFTSSLSLMYGPGANAINILEL